METSMQHTHFLHFKCTHASPLPPTFNLEVFPEVLKLNSYIFGMLIKYVSLYYKISELLN